MSNTKDINLSNSEINFGSHHPIINMKDIIMSLLNLGFEVIDGPEIETESLTLIC